MYRKGAVEMRVLILAPVGRDARLLAETLANLNIMTALCADAEQLLKMLGEGAGAAIVAQEALSHAHIRELAEWLASQPPWSDMPFLILTSSGRPTPDSRRKAHELETLGNCSLIERPVRPETIQSSVRAALRARGRQYEIRSRQEALLRANADLEQFAYSASHDLREPIRSISIYSELLTKHCSELLDGKGEELLGYIQKGTQRMETLLDDLLAYAHASSIPDEMPDPIHAKVPLDSALQNLTAAIQKGGASIVVGDMPHVRMRESHLEQLFQNLIGNAIKYRRDEPPRIQVDAKKSDLSWLFRIEDNGIGIPAEYKDEIFGIFKRLHPNKTYSGTGMGLAICQRIVERYRGRIWVESELGRGSQFFFTIRE